MSILTSKHFKYVILFLLLALTYPTVLAIKEVGYVGIFLYQLKTVSGFQVLLDLSITLFLVLIIIYEDTKKRNKPFFYLVFLTIIFGSFIPLFYFLFRKNK